jgi:hypothetical protein
MKRTVLVLAVIMIVLLNAMLQLQPLTKANPYSGPGPPSINVTYSPDFLTNSAILKIDVTVWRDITECTREAWYSLDGQKNVSIPLTFKGIINVGGYQFSEVTGETRMPMWSQGPHTIKVTVVYNYGNFISSGSKTLYIGQPEPTPPPPILTIISPQNQATYHNNQVPIIYALNLKVVWSYYALDTEGRPETSDWKHFTGNITLSGLSEGPHEIVISVKAETDFVPSFTEKTINFKVDSSNNPSNASTDLIEFTVDTTPPSITNVSPKNKTYLLSDIPLSFSIDETASQTSYSLDDQANVTISGNTTLAGLTEGNHTIVIYANDSMGNMGKSDSMNFAVVRELQPQPEAFPILLVAVSVAVVAVVAVAALAYRKKQRV